MTAILEALTERERQVFDNVVDRKTNKETARLLNISPRTVEVHRASIMSKLGARTIVDLVRLADVKQLTAQPQEQPTTPPSVALSTEIVETLLQLAKLLARYDVGFAGGSAFPFHGPHPGADA